MSNRTKGEWAACSGEAGEKFNIECRRDGNDSVPLAVLRGPDRKANAQFVAMAGTVAHKLDSLGYDGERTIEAIPDILRIGTAVHSLARLKWGNLDPDANSIFEQFEELLSALKP